MTIGERLLEERERLGFTQPAFVGLAETTKKSQIDYEKEMVRLFRAASLEVKAAAIGALKGAAGTQTKSILKVKGVSQQFNGPVGGVIQGNLTNSGKKE